MAKKKRSRRRRCRAAPLPWPMRASLGVWQVFELSIYGLFATGLIFGPQMSVQAFHVLAMVWLGVGAGCLAFVECLWFGLQISEAERRGSLSCWLLTLAMAGAGVLSSMTVADLRQSILAPELLYGVVPWAVAAAGVLMFWCQRLYREIWAFACQLYQTAVQYIWAWIPERRRFGRWQCPCCQYEGRMNRLVEHQWRWRDTPT